MMQTNCPSVSCWSGDTTRKRLLIFVEAILKVKVSDHNNVDSSTISAGVATAGELRRDYSKLLASTEVIEVAFSLLLL